jgi:hypothetical protein
VIVRKHVVKVTYLDYGSHLDTVWRTATSVGGGRAVSDGTEFRSQAEAEKAAAAWLTDNHGSHSGGVALERGDDIERTCDMNPHGLI